MSASLEENKKKFIEVVLTLGGLLGVIAAVSPPAGAGSLKVAFGTIFIVFIISALFAYSHIAFGLRDARYARPRLFGKRFEVKWRPIQAEVFLLSATFSLLILMSAIFPVYDELIPLMSRGTPSGLICLRFWS